MKKVFLLCVCLGAVLAQNFIVGNSYVQLNQNRASGFNGDGLAAIATFANFIGGVVEASNGDIFFADFGNCRIRKIDSITKIVTTVGGINQCGHTGNGGPALQARIQNPVSIAIDPVDNNIIFGEFGADTVRKINLQTGTITLIVASVNTRCGNLGDGGLAINAALCLPSGLAFDSSNNLFIADSLFGRIRRVDAITKIITTVAAGAGTLTNAVPFNNQVFFTDQSNHLVRRLLLSNNAINTVTGGGPAGNAGENVPALGAATFLPGRLDVDPQGNIFFMEQQGSGFRVRKIDATTSLVSTVAGSGALVTNNITATQMRLTASYQIVQMGSVFVEDDGDLLVADVNSIHRIIGVAAAEQICGNGIVEPGEDCDSANSCCDSNCKFQPSSRVCRALAGPCDLVERCTGSSELCPGDQLAPTSTICAQSFGVCEIGIPTACTGTGPACPSVPSSLNLPAVGNVSAAVMDWSSFSVVSFNNIIGNTGRLNGRVAAKNDISLGNGFSVADNLNNYFDPIQPYSLVAGDDLTWVSGALYPNFNFLGNVGVVENGFVGSTSTVANFLDPQIVVPGCGSTGCLNADFNAFQNYLSGTVQPYLASLQQNVVAFVEFSGLMIECADNTEALYVLNTDAATIQSVTWYSVRGCNGLASWIINIKDENTPVTFAGDNLPTISEQTVFNILGTGRTINVQTLVNGNILSPRNTLSQTGGTVNGQVYVANVAAVLDVAVVRCANLKNVIVTDFLKIVANVGANSITLVSGGNILVGDIVTVGTDVFTVTGKTSNPDGSATLTLSGTITSNVASFSAVKATVNPTLTASRIDTSTSLLIANSGASVMASLLLVVVALVVLF